MNNLVQAMMNIYIRDNNRKSKALLTSYRAYAFSCDAFLVLFNIKEKLL